MTTTTHAPRRSHPRTARHAAFPEEVVTHALVRDVRLPGGAGVWRSSPSTTGSTTPSPPPSDRPTIAGLRGHGRRLRARAEAGEIQAVGITGKPFVFAVGADLKAVARATSRDQALEVARAGHRAFVGDHGPSRADLRVRQRRRHGRRRRDRARLRLPHDLRPGCRPSRCPRPSSAWSPAGAACYLLPRLVGPADALTVIIENPLNTNRMLKGPQAFTASGMADAMFEPADFLEESLALGAEVSSRGRPPSSARGAAATRPTLGRRRSRRPAGSSIARPDGRSPAPYRALELVQAARTATRDEAFAAEDEALADLVMGDELRAGLYAFDLVQRRAKQPGRGARHGARGAVTKVGVVGAGLMASQLALLFVRRLEVPVVLTTSTRPASTRVWRWVHGEVDKLLAKGSDQRRQANRLTALVTGSTSQGGFADADVVIEAVFEEMSVKKQVFARARGGRLRHLRPRDQHQLAVRHRDGRRPRPPRARRRLPLLQPGRRHAARGDRPRRADRRGDPRHRLRHGQGAAARPASWSRTARPSSSTGCSGGSWARSPGSSTRERRSRSWTPPSPAWPRCRPSSCSDSSDRPSRCTTTRRSPRRSPTGSTSPTGCAGSSRPASPASTSMPDGTAGVDEEVRAMLPVHRPSPSCSSRDEIRERVLSVIADEARRMLDEGVVGSPMDLDLAMITGAGLRLLERRHHAPARPQRGGRGGLRRAFPAAWGGERSSGRWGTLHTDPGEEHGATPVSGFALSHI